MEACHYAVRLHYNLPCRHILIAEKEKVPLSIIARRWYTNYNEINDVETEDETEDLKVQKTDVIEEDVTEKQEMHNQEQEIVPIEKKSN
ncbi:hypothetical protein RMATCC62417_07345 [Rhizopus microsporus]|nr:hypothetical protein RMATCC62417_07345 [Rhizopus microsporus]